MSDKETKKRILEIIKDHGYRTVSGDEFLLRPFQKVIVVDNSRSINEWNSHVLHELGHLELILKYETHHMKTLVRLMNMPKYRPTDAFYRDYMRMEELAWVQGEKIAVREGLSPNGYNLFREKALETYKDLREVFK